jgi:hypothetical protein
LSCADAPLTWGFAANLVLRGLPGESAARLPALIDHLEACVDKAEGIRKGTGPADPATGGEKLDPRLRAFMIEVLLLLRYLVKDDLWVKGEVGRKIQKAVGDIRVEGT